MLNIKLCSRCSDLAAHILSSHPTSGSEEDDDILRIGNIIRECNTCKDQYGSLIMTRSMGGFQPDIIGQSMYDEAAKHFGKGFRDAMKKEEETDQALEQALIEAARKL